MDIKEVTTFLIFLSFIICCTLAFETLNTTERFHVMLWKFSFLFDFYDFWWFSDFCIHYLGLNQITFLFRKKLNKNFIIKTLCFQGTQNKGHRCKCYAHVKNVIIKDSKSLRLLQVWPLEITGHYILLTRTKLRYIRAVNIISVLRFNRYQTVFHWRTNESGVKIRTIAVISPLASQSKNSESSSKASL